MKKEELTACHVIDKYIDWNEKFIVLTVKDNGIIQVLFVGSLVDWIGCYVAQKHELKPIKTFKQRTGRIPIIEI